MKALLLSGGMDSVALAWWQRPEVAFTIDYGQLPADAEIRASAEVCREIGLTHEVLRADLRSLGAGDLAGRGKHPLAPEIEWWPFRNQMLITIAAMRAVTLGVKRLYVGTVLSDGFHVDGSMAFVKSMDSLCFMQEGQLRIEAPAIKMTSAELIRTSEVPFDVLAWAHSCHKHNYACGLCRGCEKHRQVMSEIGRDAY